MAETSPVALCQGYDSVTGRGLSTALTFSFESVDAESTMRYKVCDSLKEVMSSLEIKESLSLGVLGGLVSVNQKMKFVQEEKLTTHSISIVVYAKKTTGRKVYTHVKLRDDVAKPETEEDFANFVLAYGDSWVASQTVGGEYMAIYSYFSETQENKDRLMVEMGAAGFFDPVSVDVNLQVTLDNFNRHVTTHYTCRQRVTGIQNPSLPSGDQIIEYAQEFCGTELTAPTITHQETYGYEHVPGIGTSFKQVRKNVQVITGVNVWQKASQVKNGTERILQLHALYEVAIKDESKLQEVQVKLEDLMQALEAADSEYRDKPSTPLQTKGIDDAFKSLTNCGIPSLQVPTKSIRFPQFQGSTGSYEVAVDDVGNDIYKYLHQKKRISAIQMTTGNTYYEGEQLIGLQVWYKVSAAAKAKLISTHGSRSEYLSQTLQVPSPSSIRKVTVERWTGGLTTGLTIQLNNGEILTSARSIADVSDKKESLDYAIPLESFVLGFRTSPEVWEIVYASFSIVFENRV